jgi:type IV pilus assembly protein PilV
MTAAVSARNKRARGFTLVEVLVATVVVATGLLGSALALVAAIRLHRDGQHRTQAALLTADLVERIGANAGAGPAYALAAGEEPAEPSQACDSPGACTPAELAAQDLHEWHGAVRRALPLSQPEVAVTTDASTGATRFSISIDWVAADGEEPVTVLGVAHR